LSTSAQHNTIPTDVVMVSLPM